MSDILLTADRLLSFGFVPVHPRDGGEVTRYARQGEKGIVSVMPDEGGGWLVGTAMESHSGYMMEPVRTEAEFLAACDGFGLSLLPHD